jgi:hypothetical protein
MPPKSGWKSNIHGPYVLANLPADIYPNSRANALDIATNLAASLIAAFPDPFFDEASQRIVRNVSNIWIDLRNSATATGDEESDNTQTWIKADTLIA